MQEQHIDVFSWLKKEAIPLTSIVPDDADDDMTDLHYFGNIIGDARVVVCGEATHGTHEFFTLKHRLLKFLAEQKGFTLFAIEDGLLEVDGINQYVLTGKGDVIELLTDLRFWIWKTQEMVDLIRWMRSYNEQRGERPALQFLGLDMQSCDTVILRVLSYIDEVDPQAGDEFRDLYANFWTFTEHLSRYSDESPQFKSTCWSQLKHAQELLLAQRTNYEARSSSATFAYTLQCANIVLQAEQMFSSFKYELRSQFMAENAVWHLDQAGPQAKMFIWTHNGHAVAPRDDSTFRSLGSCLHQKYNREFKAFGMLVSQGTFNAQDKYQQENIIEHTFGLPLSTSYEYIFQSLGLSRAIVDLQQLSDELYDWLLEPRMCRSVGIMYAEKAEQNYWSKMSLPESFDGIFYVQDSTPSQLIALDRSATAGQRLAPLLISTQPRNMQFEAGLSYWQATTPPGHSCDFESGLAHSGAICAYLKSTTNDPVQFSSLHQAIKPDAYLQRRIRLSAYVKALDIKRSAGLWMRVDGANDYLRLDDMHKRPITGTSNWMRYAIVLDVPKNSLQIIFGLHFSGQGKVWIDDVQLEVVEDTVPPTDNG
jgi:erythromycin esterase